MNDELINNQNSPDKSPSKSRVDICAECKKNPCVCPNKSDDSGQEIETYPRTKPPKLTWI